MLTVDIWAALKSRLCCFRICANSNRADLPFRNVFKTTVLESVMYSGTAFICCFPQNPSPWMQWFVLLWAGEIQPLICQQMQSLLCEELVMQWWLETLVLLGMLAVLNDAKRDFCNLYKTKWQKQAAACGCLPVQSPFYSFTQISCIKQIK